MVSTHVDIEQAEWTPGIPFYGPAARCDGKDIVQLKVLSDRRAEGGGIAWLGKFSPPPGKLSQDRRDRPFRRACLQSRRRPRDKIGRTGARLGRLHVKPDGSAA